MSSLPVHQDGTCNGLQHYAALGGDDRGAQQVNLGVTDKPSDVYTHVADMVEKQLQEDVLKGEKFAQMLAGKISRKVVKQTVCLSHPASKTFLERSFSAQVMTTVYGVTFVGARDQIENRLEETGQIPFEECWQAASYLAKKVRWRVNIVDRHS